MKYFSEEVIYKIFPKGSFLNKLLSDRLSDIKNKDFIDINDSCVGCDLLCYYNDGSVFCEKSFEKACIGSNFSFKRLKDTEDE